MNRTQHTVLWNVSLSNGETIYEEKGEYQTIPGELSPWNRLLAYIEKNNLKITSLALYTESGRRFNLPSAGNNPKFHAFSLVEQPVKYKMFRKAAGDVMRPTTGQDAIIENAELYIVAEAEYANGSKLHVWVDNKTHNSWSVIT